MLRQAPQLIILIFALLLALHLQSCKVVVEDPYGNRIGDLDSLNWDSLLSSPGVMPGYSNWEWPQSSYIWPQLSSWVFPTSSSSSSSSSSILPELSSSHILSSSSNGIEQSSSSGEAESSSSVTCSYFTVYTFSKDTLYSWKELYADDYEEIRVATDTLAYPGSTQVPLNLSNWYVRTSGYGYPNVSTEWICDNQDEYFLADSNNVVRRLMPSKDTVFLNFGPWAKDSIVPLTVKLENKSQLGLDFDTLYACSSYESPVWISHFAGDSLRVTVLAPDWFSSKITSTPGLYASTVSIEARPDSTIEDTTSISWQFRIKNRFGYRDQLRMTTVVIPSPTPGTCP